MHWVCACFCCLRHITERNLGVLMDSAQLTRSLCIRCADEGIPDDNTLPDEASYNGDGLSDLADYYYYYDTFGAP